MRFKRFSWKTCKDAAMLYKSVIRKDQFCFFAERTLKIVHGIAQTKLGAKICNERTLISPVPACKRASCHCNSRTWQVSSVAPDNRSAAAARAVAVIDRSLLRATTTSQLAAR